MSLSEVRYAEMGDVQGQVPQRRFGAETTPNVEEVLGFIQNRSREIDVHLAEQGISTPVVEATSPQAWGWCRAAVTYGAAMDAEAAGFPGQGDEGETPRLAFLRKQWERMLKDLHDGTITLPDAPRATGDTARRSRGASAGTAFFRVGMVRDGVW